MAIEIDIRDEVLRVIREELRVEVHTRKDSDGDAVVEVRLILDSSEISSESDYIVMPKLSD